METQYSYTIEHQDSHQSSWQSPAPVPEPASTLLIAAGACIVALAIRKKLP